MSFYFKLNISILCNIAGDGAQSCSDQPKTSSSQAAESLQNHIDAAMPSKERG